MEIEAPIEPIRIHSDKESRLNQVRINNNFNASEYVVGLSLTMLQI